MKCPYHFPLRSRAAMADYIEGIGGYFDRWEKWPIVFNVKMHWSPSFNDLVLSLREHMPEEVARSPEAYAKWFELAERVFDEMEEQLWWNAVESMREAVDDCDSTRMLWSDTGPRDIEFSFAGRSGGYLCIDKFQGYTLKGVTPETLHEELMDKEEWPFDVVRDLYRFCVQWQQDFSEKNRKEELIYNMAWALGVNIMESEWDDYAEKHFGDGNPKQLSIPLPVPADAVQ